MICYLSIYVLLRKYISSFFSLLFLIAWAPYFAQVESAKYLIGMSFLALHFSFKQEHKISNNIFPPFLLISSFYNFGIIFFIIGHWIGILATILIVRNKLSYINNIVFNKYLYCSLFLIIFFIFSLFNQLNKPYNNHWIAEFKYVPISIEEVSSFEFSFFQYGNYRYVKRNFHKNDHYKKDWFFTHNESFNNAQSFIEAIKTSKNIIFKNLLITFHDSKSAAVSLFFGLSFFSLNINEILFIITITIIGCGLLSLILRSWNTKDFSNLFSIIIGSISFILVFMFTNFSYRYYITLLPISLILICSAPNILNIFTKNYNINKRKTFIVKKFYFLLFPFIIILGTVLYDSLAYNKGGIKNHINNLIKEIKGDEIFYDSFSDINFLYSHKELLNILNDKQRILSAESHWVISFSDADPDKVDHILILPPFEQKTSEIEKILNKYDIIMISNVLSKKSQNMATQEYLRYEVNLLPFLKNLNNEKWKIIEVPFYGKIYKNINL